MDLYSTYTLNGLVQRIRPVPAFFLTFFQSEIFHETEEVYFDVAEDKPRLAPFVHPLREGKLVESLGYSTKNVRPAYVKDKRVHDVSKPLKRVAGEGLGGTLTNDQRAQARLVQDLADQQKMLRRRLEVMSAEAVIWGKVTVTGDGFDTIVVSFGRDAALDVVLTGADKWDAAPTPDIGSQLETWDQLLLDKSGFNTTHVIMDAKAWKLMRKDEKLMKLLDIRRGADTVGVNIAPMLAMEGVSYKGMYGEFPIFVYSHSYVDPVDNTTKQVMPDNTVVLVSQSALEGVRHFGAIKDLDAGLQAMQSFTKSWTVPDPSARFLLMQSAPITAPHRPNASMRIQVA